MASLTSHSAPEFALQILYRKGSADEIVLRHSFGQDIFLPEIPEYTPNESHVILDVGAHIGTFSCLMARLVPDGRVYAIEGCRESYEILTENLVRNGLSNAVAEHLLLLDKSGSAHLYHDLQEGNWGHSAVANLSNESEIVRSENLCEFMKRNSIDNIDLLRMNCEGAEFPVIMSATPDVLACIQNILILHHEYLVPGSSVKEMIRRLEQAGFRVRLTNLNADHSSGWIIATRRGCSNIRWLRYRYWKYRKRLRSALDRKGRRMKRIIQFLGRSLDHTKRRGA